MIIERTKKEIIIRLSSSVNIDDLQDLINYTRYKELSSKFKVKKSEVDKLAKSINKKWWTKNKKRLTE